MKYKNKLIVNTVLCGMISVSPVTSIRALEDTKEVKGIASERSGSTVPINLTVPVNPINVILPTSVDLVFSGDNVSAQAANNFSITNNSKIGNIQVNNVKAKVKETGWILSSESEDSYFEQLPLDSKEIYLGFSKDSSSYTTLDMAGFDPDITVGPYGTTNIQNFQIKAKTGGTSAMIVAELIDLEMTIGYQKKDVQPNVLAAGLYDVNNNLVKSWDQLVNDGDIFLQKLSSNKSNSLMEMENMINATNFRITGYNPATLIGKLVLDNSITDIGEEAFADSGLREIIIPDSVTRIGDYAFGSSDLEIVSLPNSIDKLPLGAFHHCQNLEEITIPATVKSIGKYAFEMCPKLTHLFIPESTTLIGDSAFKDIQHITYFGPATGSPWGAKSIN